MLVIFSFQEYFGLFLGLEEGILVFFNFWGYFGHFIGFRSISVISYVLGVFRTFLGLGFILVIFRFWGVFWSFFKFWGSFGHF